jgi:hypothetical protein
MLMSEMERPGSPAPITPDVLRPLGMVDERVAVALPCEDDVVAPPLGIAPDLLGHSDLRTTHKHYIQAQGMTAHRRIQELIAARRRAGAARRKSGE